VAFFAPGGVPAMPTDTSALDATARDITQRMERLGIPGHAQVQPLSLVTIFSTGPISQTHVNEMTQSYTLLFRPVLCQAAPLRGPSSNAPSSPSPLPACSAASRLTASNLGINIATGIPANNPAPDPAFASDANTAANTDDERSTVLLPGVGAEAGQRFVLGPAGLDNGAIKSARAQEDSAGGWTVVLDLTPSGRTAWDAFAQANFHQYVAIDLDGVVLSAPLMQPTQSSFASFFGKIEISGGSAFSASYANALAKDLRFAPLPLNLGRIACPGCPGSKS
jgi:hypothetical protein